MEAFSTERLTAERITEQHFGELQRVLYEDARVMAMLGGVRSAQLSREKIGIALEHWERHGFGLWVFRLKGTGELAGQSGLRHLELDGNSEIDLGYVLRAELWGRGYGTEIARALLSVAFERLELASVTAITLPHNTLSRRVMEKAGMTYERETIYKELPHVLYRIGMEQYRRSIKA